MTNLILDCPQTPLYRHPMLVVQIVLNVYMYPPP